MGHKLWDALVCVCVSVCVQSDNHSQIVDTGRKSVNTARIKKACGCQADVMVESRQRKRALVRSHEHQTKRIFTPSQK